MTTAERRTVLSQVNGGQSAHTTWTAEGPMQIGPSVPLCAECGWTGCPRETDAAAREAAMVHEWEQHPEHFRSTASDTDCRR